MMYIHYCKYCRRIHILNGHKVYCPACSGQLKEKCADEKSLKELSVEYRMHRYSKWFKALPSGINSDKVIAAATASTDSKQSRLPEYSPRLRVSVS